MERADQRSALFFVGLVSAAILAYQLLLSRIMGVRYWSYFASMIVSLAMLGFAASGTALFLAARSKRGTGALLPWATACFILSVPACPRLSAGIHCMPLVVLWDMRQLALFAANYLLLSLPFLFGGYIVGHFFLRRELQAGNVYFANMLGSGAGILIALAFLSTVRPAHALYAIALPVAAAAWPRFAALRAPRAARAAVAAAAVLALLPALTAPQQPTISPYKGMSSLMLMPDAEVEYAGWSRFGYLTVMDSSTIRYAPGLTLAFPGTIPPQKAIFTDGDDMEAVCRHTDPAALRAFFASMLSGLAYQFHERPRVAVLDAGGGMEALGAIAHNAARVDAVEDNAAVARLMTGPLAAFSGGLYARHDVRLTSGSSRRFAARRSGRYDVVILPGERSLFASAAGTSSHDPDYMLTREAMTDFFSLLAPGGVLAAETWLNLPPRHGIKLFATAAASLRAMGLEPGEHLFAARSLRTFLLLVFRDPVTPEQLATAARFCAGRSFDRVYHPGITPDIPNRFNTVEGAPHYALARQTLSDPETAFGRHLFRLRPATDDRPYFAHFFKWKALPQLLSKTGQNVAIHMGWGHVFLLITLAQAVPLGALLILLPLSALRSGRSAPYRHRRQAYACVSALGFAFMFLELAAIQQFARFLPHPVYAFGLTVGLILLFSGAGAHASARLLRKPSHLLGAIVAGALLHAALWQLSVRLRSHAFFYLDAAAVAALAFCMGMPFPRVIERLRAEAPDAVPWAWGINGFVSVLAVLAAGLVSLSWGLTALTCAGAAAYAAAFSVFRIAGVSGPRYQTPSPPQAQPR